MHDRARWHTLTVSEQLANVGSEVERAFLARASGKERRLAHAIDRALELFDLSATDPRWSLPRRREILRAREQFCEVVLGSAIASASAEGLQRYFLAFATAVRSGR